MPAKEVMEAPCQANILTEMSWSDKSWFNLLPGDVAYRMGINGDTWASKNKTLGIICNKFK